jgi:hypothetical protein
MVESRVYICKSRAGRTDVLLESKLQGIDLQLSRNKLCPDFRVWGLFIVITLQTSLQQTQVKVRRARLANLALPMKL